MSQPRVFISLGRTGQVVERGRTASNSREARCDGGPRSGSKRSKGDGLRVYPHGSFVSTKRPRGYGTYRGAHDNRVNETGLTSDDLRLKLLRRRSKRIQCNLEERQKIGHMNQNPVKSGLPSPSNGRFQPKPEARERFHPRQISYTKNGHPVHQGDSMQKLGTSRILDEAGARSSDILLDSSRTVATLANFDGRQQFSSTSTTDVLTSKSFPRNGVFYASMPIGFTPTTFKGPVENGEAARQPAPRSGIGEKNSRGEVPLTVSGLLRSLGLEKYEIAFRAEEVDMTVLKQMGDKDLKDLGIPMGPRKKILLSLWPHSKQQPPRVRNLK
ncbi:uncharacterized protein LOC114728393 isoform X2 [Neltuma alba]|uniref:uncharacterized protein LOC114728393 isoform X2 n=1 Tax=Neltuma alba TaxID=207710 RepID=UPI0010A4505C|nr:uncharacterized protein LOC114728393 isoform X2 [Prosopis alba]